MCLLVHPSCPELTPFTSQHIKPHQSQTLRLCWVHELVSQGRASVKHLQLEGDDFSKSHWLHEGTELPGLYTFDSSESIASDTLVKGVGAGLAKMVMFWFLVCFVFGIFFFLYVFIGMNESLEDQIFQTNQWSPLVRFWLQSSKTVSWSPRAIRHGLTFQIKVQSKWRWKGKVWGPSTASLVGNRPLSINASNRNLSHISWSFTVASPGTSLPHFPGQHFES